MNSFQDIVWIDIITTYLYNENKRPILNGYWAWLPLTKTITKMKKHFQPIKVLLLILMAFGLLTNCFKQDEENGDGELHMIVYKTKADYFTYVHTWGDNISAPSTLTMKNTDQIAVVGNDTVFQLRWRLDDNYVMEIAIHETDNFTDMTYAEIVAYNENHPEEFHYPLPEIFKRVIDKDPFLEFYRDENHVFFKGDSADISKVNQLIRDGELEKYFKRIL